MYTLSQAILKFKAYSAEIPQRADMVLERCTNAVASPCDVTGALPQNYHSIVIKNLN